MGRKNKGGAAMNLEQKPLESARVYEGKVISVRCDQAQMPDGQKVLREVVEHPGGVGIALEAPDGSFYLVTQWRYAQKKAMLEFPAGKKEKGEDPFAAAQREIVEETGYHGCDWHYLGQMVPTPAYDEEVIDMYYARQGAFAGQHLDADEQLHVSRMGIEELIEEIKAGRVTDAKTMCMAFLVREYLEERKQ
jgi:ADP-ribose pyrophosphatase